MAWRLLLFINDQMKENSYNAKKERGETRQSFPRGHYISESVHIEFPPFKGNTMNRRSGPQENYCFIYRPLQAVINSLLRTLSLEKEAANALFLTCDNWQKCRSYANIMGKWEHEFNLKVLSSFESVGRNGSYYISFVSPFLRKRKSQQKPSTFKYDPLVSNVK